MPAPVLPSFADTRIQGVRLRSPLTPFQHDLVTADLALSCAMEMYNYTRYFVVVVRFPDGKLATEDDTRLIPQLRPPVRAFGRNEPLDVPTLRYLLHILVSLSWLVLIPPHVKRLALGLLSLCLGARLSLSKRERPSRLQGAFLSFVLCRRRTLQSLVRRG